MERFEISLLDFSSTLSVKKLLVSFVSLVYCVVQICIKELLTHVYGCLLSLEFQVRVIRALAISSKRT